MGVHFLQSFIEKKVPHGCKDFNIGDIFKAKKGSRSNILIIDLQAMARKPLEIFDLGGTIKKDISGGDFTGYKYAWITFLEELEKAGIEVIFVCDGALPTTRRERWISQKYAEVKWEIMPTLDSIRKGVYPKFAINRETHLNANIINPTKYQTLNLIKYELGYKDVVFTSSPNQDADKTCAGFIEKYQAFGILADDTDFLIHQFSTETFVFSIKHLNVENLDTKAYDRQKLANYLQLAITQLPLLATLKGDRASCKDLIKFHKSLIEGRTGPLHLHPPVSWPRMEEDLWAEFNFEVILKLAAYIKKECQTLTQDRLAPMLSFGIFRGDPKKAVTIQESLDSYDLTEEVINHPLGSFNVSDDSLWSLLMKNSSDYGSTVFQLMCGAPFHWGCCLEDYSASGEGTLPKSGDLWKGLRKRMYGILFYEKPGALNVDKLDFVMKVEELVMTGPDSLEQSKTIKPTMPPLESHPGLAVLWKNQPEREYNFDFMQSFREIENGSDGCHKLRWQLFSWIINPNLVNLEQTMYLYGLNETDLFMICQLFIMQHELEVPILTEKEVKSFILVNYRMKNLSDEDVMSAMSDFVPKSRPVELATIFWRSLLDIFSACVGDVVARKHFLLYNKFDGLLFQRIYLDFQDNDNISDLIKGDEYAYVNNVYKVVTSDGSKVAKEL